VEDPISGSRIFHVMPCDQTLAGPGGYGARITPRFATRRAGRVRLDAFVGLSSRYVTSPAGRTRLATCHETGGAGITPCHETGGAGITPVSGVDPFGAGGENR
jgi:hypothetical protein